MGFLELILIVVLILVVIGSLKNSTRPHPRPHLGEEKRCSRCSTANPSFAHFCRECGSGL